MSKELEQISVGWYEKGALAYAEDCHTRAAHVSPVGYAGTLDSLYQLYGFLTNTGGWEEGHGWDGDEERTRDTFDARQFATLVLEIALGHHHPTPLEDLDEALDEVHLLEVLRKQGDKDAEEIWKERGMDND